jgi:hypothetical protein
MTTTVPDSTLTAVRVQASEAWQVFTSNRNMRATLTDWTGRSPRMGIPP